jgi:threonine/homoserine/homoserine lactone efflux protein
MIPDNFLLFLVLTTLVSLAPGPNVMFIMSQAALRGHRAGMMAGFGVQAANLVYFTLTALGLGVLMQTSSLAFFIVKWAGATFLAAFGLLAIIRSFENHAPIDPGQPPPVIAVGRGAFLDGLMIGFGNPKTIFWYITFLPQFINASAQANVLTQTMLLGGVGAVIDLGVQWLYTHLGNRLSRFLGNPTVRKWFERGVGVIFLGLALLVVFTFKQGQDH